MGFTVVHPMNSQELWAIVEVSSTIYTGAIIGIDTSAPVCGAYTMPVAAGAANVTNLDIPWGVVTGNNNVAQNKVYAASGEYITGGAEAAWHDNTTPYQGVEGPLSHGVSGEMVSYIPITPETVLRGPIRQAAIGTALTVATVSNAGTNGANCVTSAIGCTPVAAYATIYFRTGPNMGIYRTLETTSTTTHTWTPALPAELTVGDTCVVANCRYFGTSKAYIDSLGVYIDGSAALTTNYLLIDVLRLDLSVPGDEYVEFRFNSVNFNSVDRLAT
jgi:hypothetical protein